MGVELRRFVLDDVPRPLAGSHAVAAGELLFVGGLLATDYRTGIAPEARGSSGLPLVGETTRAQAEYILRAAEAIMTKAGTTFDQVVRVDQYITDRRAAAPYLRARRTVFSLPRRPASTLLTVPGLLVPAATVSAEMIASFAPKAGIFTDEVPVNFPGAPHGATAGPFVFVQGQIASDFESPIAPAAAASPFWYETPVERETEYIVRNLATILEAAGSSLEDVVKAHVYLVDLADFAEFEVVWRRHFGSRPPARTVVSVTSLGSLNCRVEVNVIAVRRGQPRQYVETAQTPPREPLCESQAVRAGDFLFVSGLVAGDFRHGLAQEASVDPNAPFFSCPVERQVRHVLRQAEALCVAGKTSLDRLVAAQAFFVDLRDYYSFARVWNDTLGDAQPAVTAVRVPESALCPGARLLLDLVAYAP